MRAWGIRQSVCSTIVTSDAIKEKQENEFWILDRIFEMLWD